VDKRFDTVDERFESVDKRFDAVDGRLEAMDKRFNFVDERLEAMDKRFESVDGRFDSVEGRLERMEQSQNSDVISLLKTIAKKQSEVELEYGYIAERVEDLGKKVFKIEKKLEN
ncbi:MAG: hypothetical protein Q8898_16290, partial [Bacillota bacterium]|nr:hypothetical protein [Bacillota bacterium]